MKVSGGISFPVLVEEEGEVYSLVMAFTVVLDPANPAYVKITDSTGREYVPET